LHDKGGPRGLIRIWYPSTPGNKYNLITFIAVEPVVQGRGKGFSELERSRFDHSPGKLITVAEPASVKSLPSGAEMLTLKLEVERFNNGAHVFLVITQRDDHPDEIHFRVCRKEDSAPLKSCPLTATWGNLTRSRRIWLKDRVISSLAVYHDYAGNGFARDLKFPLRSLCRLPDGNMIAAMTTNEKNPAAVYPVPGSNRWHYGGVPVTQYWKKPHKNINEDLYVRVNGRSTYWASTQQIPGGVAFENFEMREPYYDGQDIIYGVTTKTPEQLGFSRRDVFTRGDYRNDSSLDVPNSLIPHGVGER
jgi:hypothetical protein